MTAVNIVCEWRSLLGNDLFAEASRFFDIDREAVDLEKKHANIVRVRVEARDMASALVYDLLFSKKDLALRARAVADQLTTNL